MPNISSFGAQTDNAIVHGTVTDRQIVIPDVPPQGLQSVGPRVTPHFVKDPWSDRTSYNFFDAVTDESGASYIAIKPVVPAGTKLTDENFWFMWSDPNAQFAELQEIVKTYNERIAKNASDISAEVGRATAAEGTKAPMNHASEETAYGIGNELNYGHVRLAAGATPMTSDANAGIAATPKMINDSILKDRNRKNERILLIGDSYLQGIHSASASQNGKNWGDTFEEIMGCDVEKFGNGGSGFWSNGSTAPYAGMNFLAMVNKIASDYETDKNAVTGIIFESGYNDVTNVQSGNNGMIINTVNAARNAFPNARIMVNFVYTPGWNASNKSYVGAAYTIYQYAAPQCADVFASCMNLNGIVNGISYDNIHPNEEAQQYIGMLAAYNYISGQSFDFETGSVQNRININKDHELVIKPIQHIMTQNVSTTDEPGKEVLIEESISRSSLIEDKYFYAINPAAKTTEGAWGSAILSLNTNGKVQIQHVNVNFEKGQTIYIQPFTTPAFW